VWIPEEQVAAPRRHLVLSPHYDDAALSCGGLLALLSTHRRRPRVAVIFGAEPDPCAPLTEFARFQHERWGLAPGDVIAGRQREEAAAMRILEAETDVLPFGDAIYRGDAYTTEVSLFSPPAALEAALPQEITRALNLPPHADDIRIYAPLALGGHVDHRLAHGAGRLLVQAGWTVWFYEDLPYALHDPTAVPEMGREGDWEPRLVDVSDYWREKMAAVLAYSSQNPIIFRHVAPDGDDAGIEGALAAYAEQVGGQNRKAERYWRPASE
jgi:LmbE family N-acetylglucosaminyl deacetylase